MTGPLIKCRACKRERIEPAQQLANGPRHVETPRLRPYGANAAASANTDCLGISTGQAIECGGVARGSMPRSSAKVRRRTSSRISCRHSSRTSATTRGELGRTAFRDPGNKVTMCTELELHQCIISSRRSTPQIINAANVEHRLAEIALPLQEVDYE